MRRSAPAVVTSRAVGQPAVITEDPGGGGGGRRPSPGRAHRTWAGRLVAVPLAVVALMLVFGAAQASAAWTGWGEVPGGGLTPDAPATTNYEDINYVFVRGTDNRIYQNRYDGAELDRLVRGPRRRDHAVRAVRGQVPRPALPVRPRHWTTGSRLNRYNGDAWSGWSQLGDRETFSGPQAAVYHDRLLLVIRSGSGNQRIYRRWFDGNDWGGWSQVPGNGLTPSAPHPIVYRDRVHLFVRGTDNAIYQNRYDGSTWSGWSQVAGGGLTLAAPGGHAWKGLINLYVRGTDDRIYINRGANASWSGWSEVPARRPDAVRPGRRRLRPGDQPGRPRHGQPHLLEPPAAVGSSPARGSLRPGGAPPAG